MALPYDPHEIEARWRETWEAEGVARVDLDRADPARAFYNLVEFPYPSADGLHVGHVFKYSGADVYGRYQRMRGREVFQPIGFDAFGIHTENFALRMAQHPMLLTGRTIERFRAQLSRAGMAWDWSHVVDTSSPAYYRWTQWLLVQLFRAGLMYRAEAPVTWCPSCLTVLALEQTERDRGKRVCERCSAEVTERVMRQWFLRMTAYAGRLLDGLEELDWSDRAKRLQRQWIGRSEGREIDFGELVVFTTRPDTLPAVTFLAVPPCHPAAGSTRAHPTTGIALPVVEADYVIETYGTGVVMGVPAHDARDRRFAEAHGVPVSDTRLLSPGEAASVGRRAVRYRMRDWLISRQRYWGPPIPIVHCDACGPVAVAEDQLPVLLPEIEEFRPTGTGRSPLAADDRFVHTTCPNCGTPARRETDVSDTFVDSAWYFLRYPSTDFSDRPWDDERTRRWLPVDFYAGGHEHVQRHHLYARFVTMALHDLGLVPFAEPFPRVRLGGLIVKDGAKMSKSRGNIVVPDDYIDRHGADVLRCALLFMTPWEQGGEFVASAIDGVERFFARVWRAVTGPDVDEDVAVDRYVLDVTDAIEQMHFNVAIARLMELTPSARSRSSKSVLVRLLAPFAPHLAEELWHRLVERGSVHHASWPEHDPAALVGVDIDLVIQIDGRVRSIRSAPAGLTEEAAAEIALRDDRVRDALRGRTVARRVYVPDRLINLVTKATRPQPSPEATPTDEPSIG